MASGPTSLGFAELLLTKQISVRQGLRSANQFSPARAIGASAAISQTRSFASRPMALRTVASPPSCSVWNDTRCVLTDGGNCFWNEIKPLVVPPMPTLELTFGQLTEELGVCTALILQTRKHQNQRTHFRCVGSSSLLGPRFLSRGTN